MALLALHGVSKSYGALKVTDGISLAVDAGETLGILGPNGRARRRCSTWSRATCPSTPDASSTTAAT